MTNYFLASGTTSVVFVLMTLFVLLFVEDEVGAASSPSTKQTNELMLLDALGRRQHGYTDTQHFMDMIERSTWKYLFIYKRTIQKCLREFHNNLKLVYKLMLLDRRLLIYLWVNLKKNCICMQMYRMFLRNTSSFYFLYLNTYIPVSCSLYVDIV